MHSMSMRFETMHMAQVEERLTDQSCEAEGLLGLASARQFAGLLLHMTCTFHLFLGWNRVS